MSTNNVNRKPPASIIFIFGGSGDLNQRKLAPALYNLFISAKFSITGEQGLYYVTNFNSKDKLL